MLDARNARPCFLGLALVISFSTLLSLYVGRFGTDAALPQLGWLTGVVRVGAFLGVALLSTRIGSLAARPALVWAPAACALFGACLVVASTALPAGVGAGVYAVGTMAAAAGYALLYLHWIELYARMDVLHVMAYFSLVHLASAALSLAVIGIPVRWAVAACVCALPPCAATLYARSLRASADAPFMQGESPSAGWTVPWRPVVLLGTFTFANAFVRFFLTDELKGAVLLGVVLASALALVLLARLRERLDLRLLYSVSLPLIVAASLCVLVALPHFGTLGGLLSNAAYTLFSIYATVLLCSVSYRYGVGPLWLFGFACASTSLGSLAASVLTARVDFIAADPTLLTLAVSAVVMLFVCLYVAFAARGESAQDWGLAHVASGGSPAVAGVSAEAGETFEQRCARLARRFGLTRREEEVMALLARDASYAQVEAELAIANSTLKTHVRHIYAKLGVADKRELAALVDGEAH